MQYLKLITIKKNITPILKWLCNTQSNSHAMINDTDNALKIFYRYIFQVFFLRVKLISHFAVTAWLLFFEIKSYHTAWILYLSMSKNEETALEFKSVCKIKF